MSLSILSLALAASTPYIRHPRPVAVAAPPAVDACAAAGRRVAAWAVAAGREGATVAVSPAADVPGVLRDFWMCARGFALEDGPTGRQRIIALPNWADGAAEPALFRELLRHISTCAEVCEYVGESLLVAGRHPAADPTDDEPESAPCPMLLLRAFSQTGWGDYSDENNGEEDPFAKFSDEAMDGVPDGTGAPDEEVLEQTRKWVEGIIVDMKVCPFSSTADKAGMPIGRVSYPISHATCGEQVYQAFWDQVLQLFATDEKSLSTVLLLTPRFALYSAGGFDALADTLNEALSTLRVERDIQLVFFHPEYTFRDGKERLGGDGAANFARRSPFPMINLLRTPQVRAAQKGLPTGSVYTTNERNLELVGADELQTMLDTRDWSGLASKKFAPHSENLWK